MCTELTVDEITDIVNDIENEIFEQTNEIEYFNVLFITNGFVHRVTFLDIQIWSSEDDERLVIDETDGIETLETLDDYLRRNINETISSLTLIHL